MTKMSSFFNTAGIALVFHAVPDREWFKGMLENIGRFRSFISVKELESHYYNGKNLNGSCLITFDDGDRTFYKNAFPVLKEKGVPAIVFVSPQVIKNNMNYWFQEVIHIKNRLGEKALKDAVCAAAGCGYAEIGPYSIFSILKCMRIEDIFRIIADVKERYGMEIAEKYNMSEEEIVELDDSGLVAFGAHTARHPILSNENDSDARSEIELSGRALSEMLGKETLYFAYPNGDPRLDYGNREKGVLKSNGFRLAFSTTEGFAAPHEDPLGISRHIFPMLKGTNPIRIACELGLLPVWHKARTLTKPLRKTGTDEYVERMALRGKRILYR